MKNSTLVMISTLAALAGPSLVAAQAASDIQVTAAVTPLPAEFRTGAAVLGYAPGAKVLSQLRAGTGAFICLADDPNDGERFHVACYHKALEPFMARGRELRAKGVANMDSVRNSEIVAKMLAMPNAGALYSMTGTMAGFDASSGAIKDARRLYVVYVPFATPESMGLPKTPAGNQPWLMFPGTPKAHIMFTPTM